MAQVSNYGYQKVRDFIQTNWKYIELQDSNGVAVIRIGVGDSRVTWTHSANAQTLQLQIIINGSDVGATALTPKTISKSAIFDVASGGTAIAVEDFLPEDVATMTKAEDKVTLQHDIQVPQLA